MNDEVFILGDYVSGIQKRPDLSNQPCALVCCEKGFTLSVLVGDKSELFEFPFGIIENCTFSQRVVVSERMLERKGFTQMDRDLILSSLLGPTGIMINHMPGVDKLFNNVNVGKVDYNTIFELIVEYHTDEGNKRLIIDVFEDPSKIVEFYNTIKK